MATDRQKEMFANLLDKKRLPASAPPADQLKQQFANIDKASASDWIEKLVGLEDRTEADKTPPPF